MTTFPITSLREQLYAENQRLERRKKARTALHVDLNVIQSTFISHLKCSSLQLPLLLKVRT